MTQLVTITSQRQITLPVGLFRDKLFQPGEKVLVTQTDDGVTITPALQLVRKLAGSVKVPRKYQGLPLEKTKEKAIKDYFRAK